MNGDLDSMGREFDKLDAQARAIRNRIWPPYKEGKPERQVPIIDRIRGEIQLDSLAKQLELLREKIREIIEVGG